MPTASVSSVFLFHRQKNSNGFTRTKIQKNADRTTPIRIFFSTDATVLLGPVVGPSRTGEPEHVRAGRSVLRSSVVPPAS